MLLDEVALALIERHYDELSLPKDQKALADKLIAESKSKLLNYWVRYANLEKDYENAMIEIDRLNENARIEIDKLNKEIKSKTLERSLWTFLFVLVVIALVGAEVIMFWFFRFIMFK